MNIEKGTFFQSEAFGEFQEKIPYRGKSWSLLHDGSSCLVIKQKLPLGYCWLWVPYGPLIIPHTSHPASIFNDIAHIAKEERAIFARIEPPLGWPEENINKLSQKWRIKKTKRRYTPGHSLVLDLQKDEQALLAEMKPKGRYNIGIAKKHGVTVEPWRGDSEGFDAFYEIMKKTGERDEFGIHPEFFYKTLLESFGAASELLIAREPNHNKIIAGIIIIFYKNTATYYYGASDSAYRNLMAPYLLQWEAIMEAKKRGMKQYDFLGISPPGEKTHSLSGVSEFKKKFGGREVSYPAAFDIVYKPVMYKLYGLSK